MSTARPSSVDNAAPATHAERARQKFISAMRRTVLVDLAADMRQSYDDTVAPALSKQTGDERPEPVRIRHAMAPLEVYKFYSGSRYKLQERGGRWLKLVSGLVMLGLAIVLTVRPAWLAG